MDFVLEIFDTVLFDYLYATALPVKSASPLVSSLPATGLNVTDAVLTGSNGYSYKPALSYFHIEPSQYAYISAASRDNPYRQALTLFLITWIFGLVLYFGMASFSYHFIFDKTAFNHPKFLKNQINLEIKQAMEAMPLMSACTVPFFILEVNGYGKMYDRFSEAPFQLYNVLQFFLFFAFTDCFVYWIHRGLHHPLIYKRLHKPHHKWIVPTPYASHAFHPLDGWAQSLPYHAFPFFFPLQKLAYVFLFVAVNIWTILIHDGEYVYNSAVINGAACHTMHHLYFNFNYGQYFTFWDRLGGSYRRPNDELFQKDTKMGKDEWQRQTKEMEVLVKEVEGEDSRSYAPVDANESKKDM